MPIRGDNTPLPGVLTYNSRSRRGGGRCCFGLPRSSGTLLGGRLTVALLEVGEDNRGNEFSLTELVELYDDMLLVAGKNRSEAKLGVLYLGTLRKR